MQIMGPNTLHLHYGIKMSRRKFNYFKKLKGRRY
jgi:hypothetical protein